MIEFHFFGMPIKTLGSLGKIRLGRVTGNTHISFFGLREVECDTCGRSPQLSETSQPVLAFE